MIRSMICIVSVLLGCSFTNAQQIYRLEHVVVEYSGVETPYAEAIAKTVETARQIAAEKYGFDMPTTIRISVTADPKQRVRLFNDGQDRLTLTIRSERDLKQPGESGIFHIYGLCHEVAHLAMYRPIRNHTWMTTAAAEGWAHYLGSQLVDALYEKQGENLWPDKYDYRADGLARLKTRLAGENLSDSDRGAQLWMNLAEIAGEKNMAALFTAWGQATIDPTDPGQALRKTLLDIVSDLRAVNWWNQAEPVMVFRQEKSDFAARTINKNELMKQPMMLSLDDGAMSGKRSIAGGGHAVDFQTPGGQWYLTQVQIHGSRYGHPRPPAEDFHVFLLDSQGDTIADLPFAYREFSRGAPKWVTLRVDDPIQVPPEFTICVTFNPTGTKGVYVSHDGEGSGHSRSGVPGRLGQPMNQGDWIIRAMIDQSESADALHIDR